MRRADGILPSQPGYKSASEYELENETYENMKIKPKSALIIKSRALTHFRDGFAAFDSFSRFFHATHEMGET